MCQNLNSKTLMIDRYPDGGEDAKPLMKRLKFEAKFQKAVQQVRRGLTFWI